VHVRGDRRGGKSPKKEGCPKGNSSSANSRKARKRTCPTSSGGKVAKYMVKSEKKGRGASPTRKKRAG